LVSVLVSVADSLPPKSLPHTRLNLEARVGIEPFLSRKHHVQAGVNFVVEPV
jgi:hypothetical protein